MMVTEEMRSPVFLEAQRTQVHRGHKRADGMVCSAIFDEEGHYRYRLNRIWDAGSGPIARFIGLNPSTATELDDDPTIRRCIDFSKRWGCGGLIMLNLFAWRSTDPRGLRNTRHPVGILNDYYLAMNVGAARDGITPVVCCWGNHGGRLLRGHQVTPMLRHESGDRLQCLGVTKQDHPKHPLYLKATTPLKRWA